jgi:hypothetical protein
MVGATVSHWGVFFTGRDNSGQHALVMQCDDRGVNAIGWIAYYVSSDRADAERYLVLVILNDGKRLVSAP